MLPLSPVLWLWIWLWIFPFFMTVLWLWILSSDIVYFPVLLCSFQNKIREFWLLSNLYCYLRRKIEDNTFSAYLTRGPIGSKHKNDLFLTFSTFFNFLSSVPSYRRQFSFSCVLSPKERTANLGFIALLGSNQRQSSRFKNITPEANSCTPQHLPQ